MQTEPNQVIEGSFTPELLEESGSQKSKRSRPSKAGPKCIALKDDGSKCGASPTSGMNDGYCYQHSPNVDPEARQLARISGGKIHAIRVFNADLDFSSPEKIAHTLEDVAAAVARDELSVRQANAMGYLAGTVLKCMELAISDEIRELQKAIKKNKGR